MSNNKYIESGILEQYVLGLTNAAETEEVERMAASDPAIKAELDAIRETFEKLALAGAMEPSEVIKPFLMATINYTERLKNGEAVTDPPMLNENSKPNDFSPWLNRPDMISPGTEDLYAKIIGYTPKAITAIVWIKEYAPHEVHDDEFERFLILEGTCDIIVEDVPTHLVPGDYFAIPLHKSHMVKVTSAIACKVVLQRVAA